jgi:tripartite-type tricarboxylate transporter receptor subunit TctC
MLALVSGALLFLLQFHWLSQQFLESASRRPHQWVGLSAPRNTPSEIIDRLNKEINAGLADPKLKARFADLGSTVLSGSPADFGKLIADDTEKWGKVIKFSGARAG